jgi:hypothetical protein
MMSLLQFMKGSGMQCITNRTLSFPNAIDAWAVVGEKEIPMFVIFQDYFECLSVTFQDSLHVKCWQGENPTIDIALQHTRNLCTQYRYYVVCRNELAFKGDHVVISAA